MKVFVRLAGAVSVLLAAGGLAPAPAANQRDIDAAVKKGADFLRGRFKSDIPNSVHGVGATGLAGLALIEANVPPNDPALKNITASVREAAYTATKTYDISLCVFYLDRLGDPNDVPMIQALAGRLLISQGVAGGWGYECVRAVDPNVVQRLKAMKPLAPVAGADPRSTPAKLHPEVEAYYQTLPAAKAEAVSEDNSNTQFAILAIWMSRKHGVPTDAALDAVERRFLTSQNPNGGWSYSIGSTSGSPSMTCCGLLGLATAVGRREERRLKAAAPPPPKEAVAAKTGAKAGDPFFNPPPPKEGEKKKDTKRTALDTKDVAVQAAFNNLAVALTAAARGPRGSLLNGAAGLGIAGTHGYYDLYFLWSLERVGVLFGADKIGGIDWYDFGADTLLPLQQADGSWLKHYEGDVETAFAILFLQKANLARDLSSRIQKDPSSSELRAGAGSITRAPAVVAPMTKNTTPTTTEIPPAPVPSLPVPVDDETAKLATELVRAADWKKALEKFRDTKGTEYTSALTAAIYRLDADKKKQAREALAERLTRMTAATLRTMLKSEDAELRRGAALACAMKDDKSHVPDLIEKLADADELVVRAAKAGLKSLTSQDFGPPARASDSQKQAAIVSWKDWWAKQKK